MATLLDNLQHRQAIAIGAGFMAAALAATGLGLTFHPPRELPDRLAKIEEKETRIDNEMYEEYYEGYDDNFPLVLANAARMPYFFAKWAAQLPPLAVPGRISSSTDKQDTTSSLSGRKILDVGCGGGIASEVVAREGAEVTGVDLSEGAIVSARSHAKKEGLSVNYVVGDACSLPLPNASFDGVLCSDTLEHLHDVDTALSEIARVLKPGGVLVLDTINRTLFSWYGVVLIAQDLLGYVPHAAHDWRLFITPAELRTSLIRAGLEPCEEREIEGMRPSLVSPFTLIKRLASGQRPLIACLFGPWFRTRNAQASYLAWARKP